MPVVRTAFVAAWGDHHFSGLYLAHVECNAKPLAELQQRAAHGPAPVMIRLTFALPASMTHAGDTPPFAPLCSARTTTCRGNR